MLEEAWCVSVSIPQTMNEFKQEHKPMEDAEWEHRA